MLKRSGSQRQRIWNALLTADEPLSVEEIVKKSGGEPSSARTYLNGLAKNDYATNQLGWVLKKKTGRIAPAYSVQRDDFRDWNVEKPMSPAELKRAIKHHDGSLAQFCRDIGIHEGTVTRLRQMMAGQRPITGNIEDAVREWLATEKA